MEIASFAGMSDDFRRTWKRAIDARDYRQRLEPVKFHIDRHGVQLDGFVLPVYEWTGVVPSTAAFSRNVLWKLIETKQNYPYKISIEHNGVAVLRLGVDPNPVTQEIVIPSSREFNMFVLREGQELPPNVIYKYIGATTIEMFGVGVAKVRIFLGNAGRAPKLSEIYPLPVTGYLKEIPVDDVDIFHILAIDGYGVAKISTSIADRFDLAEVREFFEMVVSSLCQLPYREVVRMADSELVAMADKASRIIECL